MKLESEKAGVILGFIGVSWVSRGTLINNFNIPYCASLMYHYTPATHTDGLRREGTERALKNILIKIKNTYSIVFTNAIYNTTDWRQTREEFIGVSRPVDQEWQ